MKFCSSKLGLYFFKVISSSFSMQQPATVHLIQRLSQNVFGLLCDLWLPSYMGRVEFQIPLNLNASCSFASDLA